MKAIVIHGPSDARYEEVPVKPPQEGEVVIQIKAIGLCGTDYELYTNEMVYIKEGLCKLPMIPTKRKTSRMRRQEDPFSYSSPANI
jgi:D-arabinose 1-dehydrogenase-like Zn-dependent alcohol dehydrogenase